MPIGYTQSPKLLKGALIQFSAPLLIPIPNIIIFQYNPETMVRKFTPWKQSESAGGADCAKGVKTAVHPLAQPVDPEESFDLSLELDAADFLEDPDNNRVAVLVGVADRIAALEMLLYPPGDSGIGNLVSAIRSGLRGGTVDTVENKTVPKVLFYWGPGRIVPVRIEGFSVDEQAYSPALFPIRAKVTLQMKVLDAASFGTDNSATAKLARAAYLYTRAQKEALALSRIADETGLSRILPF